MITGTLAPITTLATSADMVIAQALFLQDGGLIALGAAAMVVFSPIWVGLSVIYIVAALWFLSATLLRNLHRLHSLEGFVDIGIERRTEILARARRYLIGGGIVLGLLGAASLTYGIVGWVAILLGAVLVGTALLLTAPEA